MTGLLLTLVLAHGCDAGTTAFALQNGGRELNPILTQHMVVNVGLQTAVTALQVHTLNKLHRHHPKWAKGFALLAVSVEGAVVVHNLRRNR